MKSEKPWYIVLGVNQNSTDEEIHEAYWILARRYHPDKNIGIPEEIKKANEEKLKEVNAAFTRSKLRSNVVDGLSPEINEFIINLMRKNYRTTILPVSIIIKKYNTVISDLNLEYIINSITSLTLFSYDEGNKNIEWAQFASTKNKEDIDTIYCDILMASRIIEEQIPSILLNIQYKQYITDILCILIMAKEDVLIKRRGL